MKSSRTGFYVASIFLLAAIFSGCGGGGGGNRVSAPQVTPTGPASKAVGTISGRMYILNTIANRPATRATRDYFLFSREAGKQQKLDTPGPEFIPLADAKIEATLPDGNVVNTKTDKDGNWKAVDVPEGNIEFTVSKGNDSADFPVTVSDNKETNYQGKVTEDENGKWQVTGQEIHGNGADGYIKETIPDGSSDTIFETGVRDSHDSDGKTSRDTNGDGIVDQTFKDNNDDGKPDGPVKNGGGDALTSGAPAPDATVNNLPPEITSVELKDSKGKAKDTSMCDESTTLALDASDADGVITSVTWNVYDAEGNDVTSQYLNADNIVAPTFSPPAGECQKPGAYEIVATVEDANGGSAGKDLLISIETEGNKPPSAHIKANHTAGEAPLTVDFECIGRDTDGTITSYCWDFDKSNGVNMSRCDDSVASVTKTFISPGKYRATCIVTDDKGAIAIAKSVIVVKEGTAIQDVTVFTPDKTETTPDKPVSITVEKDNPLDNVEEEVRTTGGTLTDKDATDGKVTWQPPAEGGEFVVEVVKTRDDGEETTERTKIVVDTPTNKAPTAKATATPASGDDPLDVTLTVVASDEDGSIATIDWDFNDEDGFQAEQSGAQTSVKYGAPGKYTATARACDTKGSCAYDKVDITVAKKNRPANVSCFVSDETMNRGGKVSLSTQASDPDNDNLSYSWSADGGTVSPANEPGAFWTMPQTPGTYKATALVSDGVNSPEMCQVSIVVPPAPDDTPTTPAPPSPPVKLYATGGDSVVELTWEKSEDPKTELYKIYRKSGTGDYQAIGEVFANQPLKLSDTNVTNGTQYTYIAKAADKDGLLSDPSNEATASPDANIDDIVQLPSPPDEPIVDDETEHVFVPLPEDDKVVVVDPETGEIEKEIPVGDNPGPSCQSSDGGSIFVLNRNSNSVSAIGNVSMTVENTIAVGAGATACAAGNGKLFVSIKNSNVVEVYNPGTGLKVGEIPVGGEPRVCGINEVTQQVYVTNKTSNTLSILDGINLTTMATVSVGAGPNGCAVSQSDNKVYVGLEIGQKVDVVNGNTKQKEKSITVGDKPICGCRATKGSNQIVITNRNSNTITIIDGVTGEAKETISSGEAPKGAGVNERTNKIYVTNLNSNSITIISNPLPSTPTDNTSPTPPAAPGKLNATGGNSLVNLSWEKSSDVNANSYKVYKKSGAAFAEIGEVFANQPLKLVDTNVTNGTEYTYMVKTIGKNGLVSDASNEAKATPDANVEDIIELPGEPDEPLFDSETGRIFVPLPKENKLAVVNPGTGEVEKTIPVGSNPGGMCRAASGGKIFVLNMSSNTVSMVNNTTTSVESSISVGGSPTGCAVFAGKLFVSIGSRNIVEVYNASTGAKLGETPVGSEPKVCGANDASGQIYVTNKNSNTLSILDGVNMSTEATVSVGLGPNGCAVSQIDNKVYVGIEIGGKIDIVNGDTKQKEKSIAIGDRPVCGCSATESSNQIVVTNRNSNTITIIDGVTGQAVETIGTGDEPKGATVDEETNTIYITNTNSNSITVIDNPLPSTPTDITPPSAPVKCYGAAGNGAAHVTWDASSSSDVDHYVVYRDDNNDNVYASYAQAAKGTEKYDDANAPNGAKYKYKVTAIDSAGLESSACSPVTVEPAPEVEDIIETPGAPGDSLYCKDTDKLYVVNKNSNTVSVMDGETGQQISQITAGAGAEDICAPSDCSTIYVTNKNANSVSVISGALNVVTNTVSMSGAPGGCVVNENTNEVYVSLPEKDAVAVVDRPSLALEKEIPVGDNPEVCGSDPSSGRVYVTNKNDNTLSILDGITQSQFTEVSVGDGPSGCAASSGGTMVVVTNTNDNTITIVNGRTGGVEKTLQLPAGDSGPSCDAGCAVDEVTNQIFISNINSNTVTLINGNQFTIEDSIPVSGGAGCIAVDEQRHQLIISNTNSNVVTVVNNPLPSDPVDTIPPAAPAKCYATGQSSSVDITWDSVSTFDLNGYKIYRAASGSGSFSEIATVDASETIYEDGSVTNNVEYLYKVMAVDANGNESSACPEVGAEPDPAIEDVVQLDPGAKVSVQLGDYIYIGNENENVIEVIRRDTYEVVKKINVAPSVGGGGCCSDMAVDPVNNRIFITNKNTNKITIIDGTNHVIEETITVPGAGGAGKCGYNKITNEITVINENTNEVVIMNPDTYEYRTVYVEAPGGSGGDYYDLEVDEITNEIFILNENTNKVTVIDGRTYTITKTIPVADGASGCILNPESHTLYIVNENENKLQLINTTDHAIYDTVTLPVASAPGFTCGACVVDPENNLLYIINENTNIITVFDGSDFTVVDEIPVGDDPESIMISQPGQAGSKIMILNRNSNSITVFPNPQPTGPSDTTPPETPGGCRASSSSVGIEISWTASTSTDVVAYNVYRSFQSTNGFIIKKTGLSGTSFTDDEVESGIAYFYKVTAIDSSGNESAPGEIVRGMAVGFTEALVGDGPVNAIVDQARGKAYIVNSDSDSVTVINASTLHISNIFTVGDSPTGIDVSDNDGRIFVASTMGSLVNIVNPTTYAVTTTGGGFFTADVAVADGLNKYFVSEMGLDQVKVYNLSTSAAIRTLSAGLFPSNMAFNDVTNKLYVANLNGNNVTVITSTTTSDVVSATISVGARPIDVGVNSNTNMIYVANYTSGTVSVINGATNAVVATITVGNEPAGVGIDKTRNLVYIANSSSGTVSVIDGATNKVIGEIKTGDDPWAVGIMESTNMLFIPVLTPDKVVMTNGFENSNTCGAAPAGATSCCIDLSPGEACYTTMEYNPVCGSDGKTYTNGGSACCSNTDYYYPGACN